MLHILSKALLLSLVSACTQLSWGPYTSSQFSGFAAHDGEVFISMGLFIEKILYSFETPIQFRQIQNANFNIYSVMAYYEEHALDHFGRKAVSDSRRVCAAGGSVSEAERRLHRSVALAYTLVYTVRNYFPGGSHGPAGNNGLEEYFASWGLVPDICETSVCNDLSTPWGLAKTLTDEVKGFSQVDGWNADGSLTGQYNRIPFKDWRSDPYVPRNTPWDLTRKKRWQPLLEHNGLGYLTHQEHVTPHIGQAGRTVFLTDAEICNHKSPDPHYDLDYEMQLAFDRSAALNDDLKMEIETFDSKLTSLVPLMIQWFSRSTGSTNFDSWEFIQIDSVIISILYESTIVVWKEKERWDLVRPPSYAHSEWYDEVVTAWAGPYQGTKQIKAQDWRPFIRTMPHSEYPSGSACVCSAFEAAMKNWTGYDDLTAVIGGPLVFSPFGQPSFAAGSSHTEPGTVPAQPWVQLFTSWSDIAERCGISRLNGGMHFTTAVTAGRELCYDIGTKISGIFEKMNQGIAPAYVAPINPSGPPNEKRCNQASN